jgi:hypothetical protein
MVGSLKKSSPSTERPRRRSGSRSVTPSPPSRKRSRSLDSKNDVSAPMVEVQRPSKSNGHPPKSRNKTQADQRHRATYGTSSTAMSDTPVDLVEDDIFDSIEAPAPEMSKRARPPKKNASGGRDKKSAVPTIILNQFFWAVSRKPSPAQLHTLAQILMIAKKRDWFEPQDKVDLSSLQTWFRNKRFHVRKSLQGFFEQIPDVDGASKFFSALARCFELQDLALDNLKLESSKSSRKKQTDRDAAHLTEDVEFVKDSDGESDSNEED